MIPDLISRSPISYEWESYASVEVFSSKSNLSNFQEFFEDSKYTIDLIQDSETALQFFLIGNPSRPETIEFLVVDLNSEDDVWDLESYVGENEIDLIRNPAARSVGVRFVKEKPNVICDECKSQFLAETSDMDALCPECAHHLYGYPNCVHNFDTSGKCTKCFWDGSVSKFLKLHKNKHAT